MRLKTFVLSLLLCVATSSYAHTNPKLIARTKTGSKDQPAGERYKVGWMNVVTLNGDFNTMGQQYGELMQKEILLAYDLIVQKMFLDRNITTYEVLKEFLFDKGWAPISSRQKALFKGIADASGLPLEKVFILDQINLALALLAHGSLPPSFPGCSYLAAWGAFTQDRSVILARNLDWFLPFAEFAQLLTLVVFKPMDGSQYVANVAYAGWVNVLTAFNDRGLFVELNSGMDVMGHVWHIDRSHYMNELLEMMFDSDSLETLERRLATARTEFPNIISVADGRSSTTYENAPQQVVRRDGDYDGLIVATNNYLSGYWGIQVVDNPSLSMVRYLHLQTLANDNMGTIDMEVMKTIMEQPLQFPNGSTANGATMYGPPAKSVPERTVYTVVAQPSKRKMWIRIPKMTPWQEIDYGYFFDN